MKIFGISLLCGLLSLASASAQKASEQKTYVCSFEPNLPYGVSAWHSSARVKEGRGKEARFLPYSTESSENLTNDALIDRGGGGNADAEPRETAFYQAYDDRGWYLYIEAKEPLVTELTAQLLNPRSGGHNESYELFFAPGEERVPYYQLFVLPYKNKVEYYDWAMPNANYRSLKEDAHVESLPLEEGVGTFVFIPWHLLYDWAPLEGGTYRFNLIRWMPFSNAPGVTWSGQVHETGAFGSVRFTPPSKEQRTAISLRLLKYSWYKFQAKAEELATFWSDSRIGDPTFFTSIVEPEINRLAAIGTSWGEVSHWGEAEAAAGSKHLKEFMEFDYLISERRADYLRKQFLSQK